MFEEAAVPEDIARKREKITARAEKAEKAADAPAPAPNPEPEKQNLLFDEIEI